GTFPQNRSLERVSEAEAGGALGVIALAPGERALRPKRVDDGARLREVDLERVLLPVSRRQASELLWIADLNDGALDDDDLVPALEVHDGLRVRSEVDPLAGA